MLIVIVIYGNVLGNGIYSLVKSCFMRCLLVVANAVLWFLPKNYLLKI